MADRRMFTKKITDDDRFVSLPSSAQALYLHLSMSADDDGFCNQVAASMFKAHATTADLEMLLERKYLYQFADGVIVIKHWRMANALRKDRYTTTAFQEDLAKLHLEENGAYTLTEDDGCRLVAERLPQDRIGKDSIDILPTVVSKVPYQDVVDAYHEECPSLPKVIKLTDTRKKHIKARLSNHTLDELREVFRRVEHSNFCKGDNQNGWRADFDFITRSEDSIAKILEGKYDDREKNHGTNGNNQSAGRSAPRVTDEERRSIEEWEAEQRALFSQG